MVFRDTREHTDRFRALDGLRGMGALLVVLYHFQYPNHVTHVVFVKNGYLAVDLFFILSGFVLYARYSGVIKDALSLQRFLCLRFFRVYPLHFVMLLIFVALELVKAIALHSGWVMAGQQMPFTGGKSYGALIASVFLFQGLPIWSQPTWNFPSWSISCEFVAYLVFSLVVVTGIVRCKAFFAAGTTLATVSYCALAFARNTLDAVDWGLARCLAGFFFGMLIFHFAAGARGKQLLAQPTAVIGACEIAVVMAVVLTMSLVSGGAILTIVPLFIIAVVVLQLDLGPIARILMSVPIQLLGRISYSIYMVHAFILLALSIGLKRIFRIPVINDPVTQMPVFQISVWIGDALVVATVLVVLATSAVTCTLIEEPARSFGRRFFASSSGRNPGQIRRRGERQAVANANP